MKEEKDKFDVPAPRRIAIEHLVNTTEVFGGSVNINSLAKAIEEYGNEQAAQAIKEREREIVKELDLGRLLSDIHQLLTGWHSDGTAWSEWDEQVRDRVYECQKIINLIQNKKEKS